MPISRILALGRPDLRIHRKILVADGQKAVVGGRNVAREYMGPEPHPDRWTDLSILIEGPAVVDVADVFAQDWRFAAEEDLTVSVEACRQFDDGGRMQVVASGPDADHDPIYEMLVTAVFQAKQRVWLATPYFVPDESLELALVLAARRGVDLRIVVPTKSDHRFIDLSGRSFLRRIEAEGGRILRYEPTMMHAKVGVFDESLAVVGSANLDIRSLFLNYEIATLLYSPAQEEAIGTWMETLFSSCSPGLPRQTRRTRFLESMGRLMAPMV
jgi:cardiolipin synthase